MRASARAASELEETGRRIELQLRREHLTRLDLSGLEAELHDMLAELNQWLAETLDRRGSTPDLVLASAALRALEDSTEWARCYRKHAPLGERREHIASGLQGALGAIGLVRRAELSSGPHSAL